MLSSFVVAYAVKLLNFQTKGKLCVEALHTCRVYHQPLNPRPTHRCKALEELFLIMCGSTGLAPVVLDLFTPFYAYWYSSTYTSILVSSKVLAGKIADLSSVNG